MKFPAFLAAACLAATAALAQPNPERQAANEKDYRSTLTRVGVQQVRPGADGFNRQAPNAANYDEARVGAMPPLPPLLANAAGQPVTTRGQWERRRREL